MLYFGCLVNCGFPCANELLPFYDLSLILGFKLLGLDLDSLDPFLYTVECLGLCS